MDFYVKALITIWLIISVPTLAEGIDRIEGAWVNNGNTIAITRNQFGWDLWQDNKGRASMELSSNGGGNIQVTFRGSATTVCNYYVTTTNNRSQMVLKLTASTPDSSDARGICIDGVFNRVDTNAVGSEIDAGYIQVFKGPDKPVENGTWKYEITCPGGASFSSSPLMIGGRHAGSDERFSNDLTFGYLADGRLQVRGYIGKEPAPLEFAMSKSSEGKFTGPGKVGSNACVMSTSYVDSWHMSQLLRVPKYRYNRETVSVEIKCGNSWYNKFTNIQFLLGLAGFGYSNKDGVPVVAQLRLAYDQHAAGGKLFGYLYTDDTTTVDFDFSKSSVDQNGIYYTGWGKVGKNQNCSISIGANPNRS